MSTPRAVPGLAGNALALLALLALAAGMASLQTQAWTLSAQPARWLIAGAALFAYTAWVVRAAVARRAARAAPADARALIVWHASQTGTAAELAERTAATLRQAGIAAQARSMLRLTRDELQRAPQALFVVSTTGEGDAPDDAARFVRDVLGETAALAGLRYGVLALGDRDYGTFCAFGRRLDAWLRRQGAQPLFDLVEVDDVDAGALRHWQHHLAQLSGAVELPDWSPPSYSAWTLRERRLLNPGSAGGPVFHVGLVPAAGPAVSWRGGDIAEIGPRHARRAVLDFLAQAGIDNAGEDELQQLEGRHLPDPASVRGLAPRAWLPSLTPLPHREYSIASVPADGALWLLIRQLRRPDGSLGLGAGWLTEHAAIGAPVAVRLRANPAFRLADDAGPLVLIGNGSGMAGLRALLRERIEQGRHRNWLLFGERNAAHDAFHGEEIARWLREGKLARVDWAWSRDGEQRIHVQQRVRENGETLRRWVADGAAIHVCGSLAGMAPGVDAGQREVLGDGGVEVWERGGEVLAPEVGAREDAADQRQAGVA
jgi:sulfite reductase (NADPH) flavoprotein alpha-component